MKKRRQLLERGSRPCQALCPLPKRQHYGPSRSWHILLIFRYCLGCILSLSCADLFRLARGSTTAAWIGLTLSFTQLWAEEEEEGMVDLPMMGIAKATVTKDLVVTMDDIFGDLCPEEQTSMAFSEVVEGRSRTRGDHSRASCHRQRPGRGGIG